MRFGIDLGGTKTEILALTGDGATPLRRRIATPKDYDSLLRAMVELVRGAESETGVQGSVGMAIPGSESFGTNVIKNANTTYLIGKPLRRDMEQALGRPVRLANDANCFALSEASDGAAAGAHTVFGIIAGTGVGGGVVVDGKVLDGAHGIAGEWGHIPLPAPTLEEVTNAPPCYCGKRGCLEVWCSGPGLTADFKRITGREASAEQIAASDGQEERAAMDRWTDRMARGIATLVNILDPDVIVMGGGLSNIERLYPDLPPLVEKYGFNPGGPPKIVKNLHGDSSGVRGAAWLWSENGA
ncbi:MAG TPA: ROK family protein [Rhizomicrobium sp.]|nr:ROK family protein [Rhizomicrobium sp.]